MMPGTPDRFTEDIDRRMALAREWDDLVEEVRGLPGFEDFLRPPRAETLLPAAEAGPVVIINVSRWRCDALVVTTAGIEVIELDLTQQDVVEQVQAYLDAVSDRQRQTRQGAHVRDADAAGSPDGVEARLDACLRWMWDSFAARILDHLEYRDTPPDGAPWPRVWWCPTGPLTLLPIHAAGHHHTPGKAVIDRVVSSYTPTLRALIEARRDRAAGPARMLFVGMPKTPDQAELPNVRKEQDLVTRLFTGGCTTRIGPAATRDKVLSDLGDHTWVHFACHGEQDLNAPSHGGLLVQDGRLTVTDLSARPYPGEFAYLSGCKTALGGAKLPDEAITLAAALHYTGYRHVIATLWSVWDAEAAQVAEDVYAALIRDGKPDASGAALALHGAVRTLRKRHRERHRERPSVWTPFAHTGP